MGGCGSRPSGDDEDALGLDVVMAAVCGEDNEDAQKPRIMTQRPTMGKPLCSTAKPAGGDLTLHTGSYMDQGYKIQCLVGKLQVSKDNNQEALKAIVQMAQVQDTHVLKQIGFFPSNKALFVLFENGDKTLLDYLKEKGDSLSLKQRLKILADISDGMAALDDAGFAHGNLSCATCVVETSPLAFKVGPWAGRSVLNAIRTAPELLQDGADDAATSHADAWAFGVLVLEVFGCGVLPVDDPDNDELWRDKITAGDVTLPTDALPTAVAAVVDACFAAPDSRPDFFWLRAEFQDQYEQCT
ncbi:serine/threonine protein kinase [Salpingoeca rosetta]|uniref:Serine/threonine protein kinase n=1 Tax=Salpingoeca rosetta (strain ATCC 50818 / BSB-021) TaxID=946362 RepID=F2UHN2_SALR5|nr:serine/threonine protein kinase [Salpingoeca rosetta]EGD76631.1 serine/threonine protein kinase [Salpingoeca rosetta]|eukprot:XP_004991545.1 serine/threonine protein kinase [Salpingoeca rosetta]